MKKYILILLLGLSCMSNKAQEIFSFDFSGDPNGNFIVWDVDKNTPTATMQKVGFKVGSPWVIIRESNESSNWFYGSTSSYEPAGQANDWLVVKGLFLQEEGCVLEWKSQAYDPQKRDGLKIFISTKGQSIEDFSVTPDWEIAEESAGVSEDKDVIEGEGEWTFHSLSLDKYAGQMVYIAFVNQSNDKSIIFLDDIWVGKHQNYVFSNISAEYIDTSNGEIKGTLEVVNDVVINTYTAHYSYGDKEYIKEYSGLNLKEGDTHEFVFDEKIPLELHQVLTYKMWVTIGEENSMSKEATITRLSHFPERTVVIEEGTGTWCKYCVSGMWAMDHLYEMTKEAKDFIGIAVHNGDPLTNTVYDRSLGFRSFPTGAINRKIFSLPIANSYEEPWGDDSWVYHYTRERERLTFCDLNVEGTYTNDSTSITAKATVTSVLPFENIDFRIAFVLLENGITGYSQLNAYAGAPYELGGFESLTNPCYPVFNDIARGIWPEFAGKEGSVPSTLIADESVEYSYEIDIPKSVENKKNLRLVALLLNASTKEVLNGAVYSMTATSDERTSSISNLKIGSKDLLTKIENGRVSVFVETENPISACLFDVTGKIIDLINVEGGTWFTFSANGYHGIAFLQIRDGNGTATQKVIL